MTRPPSLLIAIPARDYLRHQVWPTLAWNGLAESLLWWKRTYGDDADVGMRTLPGAHVHLARCQLAEFAIIRKYDWVLWMDDDACPPPNMLRDLMASEKDWIAPLFTAKSPPYKPCCFTSNDDNCHVPILDIDPPRLFQADSCGFHTVLMKTDVLRKTQDWAWENLGAECSMLFPMRLGLSEDIAFCVMAKKAGHQLWIDSRIEVGHGSDYIATPQHFRAANHAMHGLLQQAPTVAHYA